MQGNQLSLVTGPICIFRGLWSSVSRLSSPSLNPKPLDPKPSIPKPYLDPKSVQNNSLYRCWAISFPALWVLGKP